MITSERMYRIKLLHAEFEEMGQLSNDWGKMAHEHRAELIHEVERLRGLIIRHNNTMQIVRNGVHTIDLDGAAK